jgi:hypothetical protein
MRAFSKVKKGRKEGENNLLNPFILPLAKLKAAH